MEKEQSYEYIISQITDTQLIKELAIVNEEETLVYIKKKALKEELKRRLAGK